MSFAPKTQDEFSALSPQEQMAYRRAVDALQARNAPPAQPVPLTIEELRAECERHRRRIVEAMGQGQRFYSYTDANFVALVKGDTSGHLLPSLERLWHAATVLDVRAAPPFLGEPQTALAAVAALDGLFAALRGTAPAKAEEGTKAQQPGGRPPLKVTNPKLANLYERIIAERKSEKDQYAEVASRLRNDKDFVELAKAVGVKIDYKLIRRAIDWSKRPRNDSDKATNSA